MPRKLDHDAIAKLLGAKRRGRVVAEAGYFGAQKIAIELQERLKIPAGGGRATDPSWTERRQVPLTPERLEELQFLAERLSRHGEMRVEPMQPQYQAD